MGSDEGERLEAQLGWVKADARRLARRAHGAVEADELFGWGSEGLVEAARSFDPARGVPFAAYARRRVRGAMLDGLRAMSPVPLALHRARLAAESAEPPSGACAESRHNARFESARADGLLFATAEASDGPVAAASADHGPEVIAARRQLRRIIALAVAELPAAEAEIVRRHALADEPLAHAALCLGVGEDRASRLYKRALQRLRSRLREAW